MPLIDCRIKNDACDCTGGGNGDNPFSANISSERPDVPEFLSINNFSDDPLLGSVFGTLGCRSFCVSTESQADADLCARNQAAACVWNTWLIPVTSGPGAPTVPLSCIQTYGYGPECFNQFCFWNPSDSRCPGVNNPPLSPQKIYYN